MIWVQNGKEGGGRVEDMELQNKYHAISLLDIGFCFCNMFEMEKKGEGEDMELWNEYNLGGYKCNWNGENKNRTPFYLT